MSANNEDDKESHKSVPLDLARNQITTVRTIEGKAPLVMSSQSLRGMRVLTQGISSSGQNIVSGGSTIITTNIVAQAGLKQEASRAQISNLINSNSQNSVGQSQGTASITLQRPTQITLSTTPVVPQSGTTYHVPRGPAVVANLAAPRSNVTGVRSPMIVSAQSASQVHSFTRPPRTPSPAQGTAWLNTNTSNGSQIKGAPTVLSSPVRGATLTGKPQLINRAQASSQGIQTLRPTAAILHSAITIGQPGQIHSFKANQSTTGIQALNSAVTIAQVLPPRTQAIVYNPSSTNQFIATSRLTVATTVQNQRQQILRPAHVTSARVALPSSHITTNRPITPQGAILTPTARISSISTQPTQTAMSVGNATTRVLTTQPTVTINRLAMGTNSVQVTSGNNLGQARILHSLVAVANSQAKSIQTSGTKVITQTAPGTIHLTPLTTPLKTTHSNISTLPRTINVPAALVAQRPSAVVSSQTIPIVKAFQPENQSNQSVFIHAPMPSSVSHRATPSPTSVTQTSTLVPVTTVAAYTIPSGTFFYDASGTYSVSRSYGPQSNSYTTISQGSQPVRPTTMATQVHITNQQQMRYNSVMVVDPSRNQQFTSQSNDFSHDQQCQQNLVTKATASPRPSILRKRDHEGAPLKVAKNLNCVMTSLPQQSNQRPLSPVPRPDSRGNGNSSGGSTTISATSSPGLAEVNEDSLPHASENHKEDEYVKPPIEMSPRKKPRKQQLTGNDIDEHNDDMQFISDNILKKEEESDGHSDEPRDGAPEAVQLTTVRKPASASLLNSYRQTWKATHNHYVRYSDVRPKDERKLTIIDLANQYRVLEKVNGWKVYHLSTQMEDLTDQEASIYTNLSDLLKCMEKEEVYKSDKDINRINELIKGNLQRIKIIGEGMTEAKIQMMRVFDHKSQVTDIINRCASKRNFKKREKS